ncbi:MAG: hypothetical protein ABUR63_00325 [Verrucomicrobiota bacterium]
MSAIPFTSHYLECDATGCDETFVMPDTDQSIADVRSDAADHGWTVDGDRDLCSRHERAGGG